MLEAALEVARHQRHAAPSASAAALRSAGSSVSAVGPPPGNTPVHRPEPATRRAPAGRASTGSRSWPPSGRRSPAAAIPARRSAQTVTATPPGARRREQPDRRDPGQRDLDRWPASRAAARRARTPSGTGPRNRRSTGTRGRPPTASHSGLPRLSRPQVWFSPASFGIRKYSPTSAAMMNSTANTRLRRVTGPVGRERRRVRETVSGVAHPPSRPACRGCRRYSSPRTASPRSGARVKFAAHGPLSVVQVTPRGCGRVPLQYPGVIPSKAPAPATADNSHEQLRARVSLAETRALRRDVLRPT